MTDVRKKDESRSETIGGGASIANERHGIRDGQARVTPPPSALVDQNFLPLCSTVPVAWTVTVSPLLTVGPLPAVRICGPRRGLGKAQGRGDGES